MKKQLVAVVLAGGVGNRFWPITTNKITFPFAGSTTLEHALGKSLPKEVSRLVVVTSEDNDEYVRRLSLPIAHSTVIQKEATGMAGALLTVESQLHDASLLIINGDDVYDVSLFHQVVKEAQQSGAFGVIPVYKPDQYFPGGYVKLEGERIVDIIEKPGEGNTPSPYTVTLGHYIEDSSAFFKILRMTTSDRDDVYEKTLSTLMQHEIFVMTQFNGEFSSLKYPWHILSVMDVVLKGLPAHRGKNITIKDNVIIEGNVYIEDDVTIFENTKITGPTYIGKGTIIGNNNIIRHSHIGARCVTGFSTDITRSYIGDDCWFHSNYIGDSVLEKNISMGSGAVLANLRLDDGHIGSVVKNTKVGTNRNKLGAIIGQGVRIGVNASIMPGVKIGHHSFVGSGVVLASDLQEESFCVANPGHTVKKNRATSLASRDEFRKKI